MHTETASLRSNKPPTLSAIAVGLATFQIALVWVALVVGSVGGDRVVLQSVIASYGGGVAGLTAFAAVYLTSGRSFAALGLRRVSAPWLFLAIGLGVGGFGVSTILQDLYADVFGQAEVDTQAMLHVAIQAGMLPFAFAFVGGAVVTPIGEEFLFRGVIANALNKYGIWAGVGLSALIFGIVHGLGVILVLAILMGLIAGFLFRTTESVWPCVVLHGVYNGLHSVNSALGPVSAP